MASSESTDYGLRTTDVLADPKNILVIHFGQLGDVILGLPALDALRARFPGARITALTGTPADQIARLAGLADLVVGVNRHALKDAPKLRAVRDIVRLALELRRARYDAVVDLHAFYETGLLARFSGAPLRVGPDRENRSLPFAYTVTSPPEDRSAHLVERYLAIAGAAGAPPRVREPHIAPAPADAVEADRLVCARFEGSSGAPLVGLNPGAGFEARRWPGDRFAELGRAFAAGGARVAVFAGPEERGLGDRLAAAIGPEAAGFEGMTLGQLAAVMRRCAVVVSNDTGPAHISAAVGTPTLVLMPGNAGPSPFAVRGERKRLIYAETVAAISTEEVVRAAREMLA
jgi:ADP-heptose:LPS heptosyltransferase